MEKLCKNCAYGSQDYYGVYRCWSPSVKVLRREDRSKFYIDGTVVIREDDARTYCSVQRRYGYFESWMLGTCGKRGKWWKQRESKS